jgi:hypothetical protein
VAHDDGLNVLRQSSSRDRWWDDAADGDLDRVDRALSGYDVVAWYVARKVLARQVVVDACGDRIVELWELAYPYVLDRRRTSPELWSSLAELYVDAHAAPTSDVPAARLPAAVQSLSRAERSVSPDNIPVVDEPAPVVRRPVAAAPPPIAPEALSAVVEDVVLAAAPPPGPLRPAAPQGVEALRRALSQPADLDLVETEVSGDAAPAPSPVRRPAPAVEQVIDLDIASGRNGALDSGGLHSR